MKIENQQITPSALTESWFVPLALGFGILLVFLIPPLQVADEDSHFKKAFQVSHGALLASGDFQTNKVGGAGNYFPENVLLFEQEHRSIMGDAGKKYSYKRLYEVTAVPTRKGREIFAEFSTASENPILYIPQAIGITIGRVAYSIFGLRRLYTPAAQLYFGRLFNLLFFVTSMAWAIKIAPNMKRTIMLVAVMPMTFNLATSVSRDVMPICASALVVALFLKIHLASATEKIGRSDYGLMSVLAVLLLAAKQVYFPIWCIFALLSPERFGGSKTKRKMLLGFSGLAVFVFCLHAMIQSLVLPASTANWPYKTAEQVTFIIGHPFEYVEVLLRTIGTRWEFYFTSAVGNLGWLDTNFPYPFIVLTALFLGLIVLVDGSAEMVINWKMRALIGALAVASSVFVFTGLYVTWTTLSENGGVGAPIVEGVQGRYFLPLLLLVLPIIGSGLGTKLPAVRNTLMGTILPFVGGSFLLTVAVVLLRYWIP